MRYYFDISNGIKNEDDVGIELESPEIAIAQAAQAAADLSEEIKTGGSLSVKVRDPDREIAVVTVEMQIKRC